MKIAGIIAEFNPFHNGHAYVIDEARRRAGADRVIVVMSGDFVQRGAPAFVSKWERAQAAVKCGADLVLELPVFYSLGSAPYFAFGGVSLLSKLGVCGHLVYGTEHPDIPGFEDIIALLCEEPAEYTSLLKKHLKNGLPYPAARADAVSEYLHREDVSGIFSSPNMILALEYEKAVRDTGAAMKTVPVPRKDSSYHDLSLDGGHVSAAAIRRAVLNGAPEESWSSAVPEKAFRILSDAVGRKCPVTADDFSLLLHERILSFSEEDWKDVFDVSPDLARRIVNLADSYAGFDDFCMKLKTKNITYTHIARVLCHALLDIRKNDAAYFAGKNGPDYARVLAVREESKDLLGLLSKTSSIPLIAQLSQTDALPDDTKKMLAKDLSASNLYQSVAASKFNQPFQSEQKRQLIIS